MKTNIVLEKSMDFAIKTVDIYKYLTFKKKEYVMSEQLLKVKSKKKKAER